MSEQITALYKSHHQCALELADNSLFELDSKTIDRVLRKVSSKGFDLKNEIQQDLFNHTLEQLNRAITGAFGEVKYSDDDYDYVNELKSNNAVFAAFKTHSQQRELHQEMFNEKGKPRSFVEFKKASEPIIGKYNTNWLQTEYNTACIRAQNAVNMRRMAKDADVMPNAQWMPSTSVNPREDHKAFYYKIFPIGGAFLKVNQPGSLWGCKCSLSQTSEIATEEPEVDQALVYASKPQKGLDCDPSTSGKIFSSSHPYIANCSKSVQKNVALESQKMMSEISRREVRAFFKEQLKKPHTLTPLSGPINKISLSYQDIKNITGKPHKFNYQKNQACYFLPEIFKKAQYVGCSPDVKGAIAKGHADVLRWHYYSFELNTELSYITIKENLKGECKIHSIQDSDHFIADKVKQKP